MSSTFENDLQKFAFSEEEMMSTICASKIGKDMCVLLSKCAGSLKAADYVRCKKYCEIMLKIVWEKLNTGHWKDVDINWRLLYSAASLCKTLALAFSAETPNEIQEALKSCDMGLLMGAPISENCLAKLASVLHLKNREMQTLEPPQVKRSKASETQESKICAEITEGHEVKRAQCPSLMAFQSDYLTPKKPVIITEAIEAWPARSKWSIEYILEVAGYRTVPIEIGSKYTDLEWSQKIMPIQEFVRQYFHSQRSQPAYLAQHQLFDQILELRSDIQIPDYCFLTDSDEDSVDINAWFGPGGTVSPLHQDPRENFLVQVFGSKYVRLYDISETENVYPIEEGMMSNTSQVDIDNPDFEKFPKLKNANFEECILGPGEILYIPKQWWHFVKSLENSFSVSFWFGD